MRVVVSSELYKYLSGFRLRAVVLATASTDGHRGRSLCVRLKMRRAHEIQLTSYFFEGQRK